MARCKLHDRPLICPSCVGAKGGAKGGKSTSPKKVRAAKKNAQLGGRPKGRATSRSNDPGRKMT